MECFERITITSSKNDTERVKISRKHGSQFAMSERCFGGVRIADELDSGFWKIRGFSEIRGFTRGLGRILGILGKSDKKCCFLQEKSVKTYKNIIKTLGSLYATFAGCVGGVRRPDEVDFRGFSKNARFVQDLSQIKGFRCRSSGERSNIFM